MSTVPDCGQWRLLQTVYTLQQLHTEQHYGEDWWWIFKIVDKMPAPVFSTMFWGLPLPESSFFSFDY